MENKGGRPTARSVSELQAAPPGGGTSVYMLCISDRDSQGDGSKVQLRGGPAAAFGATLKTFYKVH